MTAEVGVPSMRVHLIGDTDVKLSILISLLKERYALTVQMLPDMNGLGANTDAVIVAADLRNGATIAALKQLSGKLTRINKRIFLTDTSSRLALVQAYALGATTVLPRAPTGRRGRGGRGGSRRPPAGP